jgi:chromosome segregation ATPase
MSAFIKISAMERLEEEVAELKAENEVLKQRVVAMTTQLANNRKVNKKIVEERDSHITQLKAKLDDTDVKYDYLYNSLKEVNEEYDDMKNRLNAIIDARDDEINELKQKLHDSNGALDAMRDSWNLAKKYTDDVISQRNADITNLKNQLAEQIEYTEKIITEANQTEQCDIFNNAQLNARVEMLTEMSNDQMSTIQAIKDEHTKKCAEMTSLSYKMVTVENENTALKAELAHYKNAMAALASANTYMTNIFSVMS